MSTFRICSGARSPTWSRVLAVVVMSLFLTLSVTVCAYAEEGFLGGLQTLVDPDSAQEVVTDPVRDYEYEPVLLEEPVRANGDELTELSTMDGIRQVVNRTNRVDSDWNSGGTASSLTLLEQLRRFLGSFASVGLREVWVTPAIVMVFGWWALRKTVRMIMRASKGKGISV